MDGEVRQITDGEGGRGGRETEQWRVRACVWRLTGRWSWYGVMDEKGDKAGQVAGARRECGMRNEETQDNMP